MHPQIDTVKLEEEIREAVRRRQAAGIFTESLQALLTEGRLEFTDLDEDDGLKLLQRQLAEIPRVEADFRTRSVHPGIGPLITAFKRLVLWAVRGTVQNVVDQQQYVNQMLTSSLQQVIEAVAEQDRTLARKMDKRYVEQQPGFDRAGYYRRLGYPVALRMDWWRNILGNGAVWDLGAGDGALIEGLPAAVGVDYSHSMVERAEELGRRVMYGDLFEFLWERRGERVDAIALSRVVDYLTPVQLTELLGMLPQHLAVGGRVLIISGPRHYIEEDMLIQRFYPVGSLAALATELGFRVRQVEQGENGIRDLAGIGPVSGWYGLICEWNNG